MSDIDLLKMNDCLYCGSHDYGVDLDGMGRVIVCKNCGTRVPIAVMEDTDLRPKCEHHKDDVSYLGNTSWKWCEKCGALGNFTDWQIPGLKKGEPTR